LRRMPPKKRQLSTSDDASNEDASANLFDGMVITLVGSSFTTTQAALYSQIESMGATTARSMSARVTHVITTPTDYNKKGATITKAIASNLPILSEEYVTECLAKKTKLDTKDYLVAAAAATAEEEEGEEEEEEDDGATTAKAETKKTTTTTTTTTTAAPATRSTRAKKTKSEEETPAAKKDKEMEKKLAEVDSDLEDDSDEEEEETQKTKVQIKGRCAVDTNCSLAGSCHVYDDGTNVYDATLNQTEIKNNNNKFYIIQLLESDNSKNYYVWNRWGREGQVGQSKVFSHGTSLSSAISDFSKKFQDKTKNAFSNRANFHKVAGKYDMVEIDYTVDTKDHDEKKKPKKKVEHKAECSLDTRVQNFIKLIFDLKMMKRTMIEAEFDLKKMPLGKLSKNQIKKGYEVLKEIEEVIKRGGRGDLTALSSRFYTIIPHVFGMRVPPVINSFIMLQQKMDMLANLADIEIATNLIKDTEDDESNLLEAYYKQLKCTINPIDSHSEEYDFIQKYVNNTYQGSKKPTITSVFRIEREGEVARFDNAKHLGNRKLLWHGSRLTNFVGIISQGLRIAPPEAPVSGYRFGKGIYFADVMSLSAAYCRTSGTDDFCMFLGDVALGKTADLYRDTYMEKPQPGSNSTLALGMIEPDPKKVHKHKDGFEVPLGEIVNSPYKSTSCKEHQYVVYDVSQVNLRYLLQLK
ncbi:hypothetical protein SAMD00019534_042730, partial [Acytostelium subglobosum LB1]|uniref:hypothetical protein n=1 Tax=Acytostelium subglobosum LB1 TaxID=1410327 RepID=UPI000644B8FD